MYFHFLEQIQVDCGITHNNISELTTNWLMSHYETANFRLWSVLPEMSHPRCHAVFLPSGFASFRTFTFADPILFSTRIWSQIITFRIYTSIIQSPLSTEWNILKNIFCRHVHKRDTIFVKHTTCICRL